MQIKMHPPTSTDHFLDLTHCFDTSFALLVAPPVSSPVVLITMGNFDMIHSNSMKFQYPHLLLF